MNRVHIEPTRFENKRSGVISLGFRMYDDEGQTYDNTWKSIPDDDMELLSKVMESVDEQVADILSYMEETNKGVWIGDVSYTWVQIKHLFKIG